MDYKEIVGLANCLEVALTAEHRAKVAAADAVAHAEGIRGRLIRVGRAEGVIDGPNADTRKRQEQEIVAASEIYALAMGKVRTAERHVAIAGICRKWNEAVISLTRAWLYSQRGALVESSGVQQRITVLRP